MREEKLSYHFCRARRGLLTWFAWQGRGHQSEGKIEGVHGKTKEGHGVNWGGVAEFFFKIEALEKREEYTLRNLSEG